LYKLADYGPPGFLRWQNGKEKMKNFILFGFLFGLATASVPVDLSILPAGVERVDIYLLLGQSNMKGRGEVPETQVDDPLIVNMNMADDQWYMAKHPLHKAGVPDLIDGSDNAGVGPGLDFARGVLSRTNGVRIALVPCAVGGSWINLWQPGQDFYTNAVYRAQKALEDAPPGKGRIAGVLWLQGESDATEARYEAYSDKLSTLIRSLRSDLNEPDLPFIACTIGTFINSNNYPRVTEMNAALLTLPDREPYTACVDARDLTGHIGDNMHYSTESQRIIGKRYVDKAEEAVAWQPALTGSGTVFSTDFESATQPGGGGTPVDSAGSVAAGFSVSDFTFGDGALPFQLRDDVNWLPGDIHLATPAGSDDVSTMAEAVASNRYCQFTLSANTPADLTELSLNMTATGSAKTGHLTVRSSVDNYTADLGSVSSVMNGEYPLSIDLSAVGGFENCINVTFRFYLYDEYDGQNNRYMGVDDIQVKTGSATAFPISFASIFSSGCVLQRDQTASIRGQAQPGETVSLSVRSQYKTAVTDSSGIWRIELDPEPAGGPVALTVSGSQSASASLTDVYFGDVWLLTGQSNMQQSLATQSGNFPEYYPEMPNASDDLDDVRFAQIAMIERTDGPADEVVMDVPWNRWEAEALADMSAVGYFFACELNAALDANGQSDVPLGFVKVCKGATAAEQWISAEAIDNMPEPLIARDGKPASSYYNGMVAPIRDFAVKGVLWYQGEANADTIERIKQYPLVFKTLVESWREQRGNPEMPFYFVQLAPFRAYLSVPADQEWAWMREAQTRCLSISKTAMACIIDSGLQGDIHPPYKDRVGHRLARIALEKTYGLPVVSRGPVLQSIQINGSEVVLTFDHAADGLRIQATEAQPDAEELSGFTLCGEDPVFYRATQAEIIGANQVRISNPANVPAPVAVRYAWQSFPRCNLFNSEGLPAEPFRTDSYEFGTSSGGQ
jgi:sialate O-acetylesterase